MALYLNIEWLDLRLMGGRGDNIPKYTVQWVDPGVGGDGPLYLNKECVDPEVGRDHLYLNIEWLVGFVGGNPLPEYRMGWPLGW
jgi:hypothetical protein